MNLYCEVMRLSIISIDLYGFCRSYHVSLQFIGVSRRFKVMGCLQILSHLGIERIDKNATFLNVKGFGCSEDLRGQP